MMTAIARSLALVIACHGFAYAAFEDMGAGARAPGMGNAFTALADDVNAIHYNPAGLAQIDRAQASVGYSKLHLGLDDGSNLGISQFAYAHPLRRGRWGTVGTSFQRLALNDIYQESTLHLSWGKSVLTLESGSALLLGFNGKYLTHSFKPLAEAFAACNGLNCNQGPDPVLAGSTSKSAMDADLGIIYRFPRRFQLGLMAKHLMSPDVGFGSQDKLPMAYRFGGAYRSLWMTLMAETHIDEAPSGDMDKNIVLAAERLFPTLDYGTFGVRTSLSFGDRDWKQITTGFSYRINKIQTDYAFLMPIGTVKGTAGTHRMAITFFFGSPTAEQQMAKELLEQVYQVRSGKGPAYGREYIETMRPHALTEPRFELVRREIELGRYREAHFALTEVLADDTPDPPLVWLSNRIALVAIYYPELNRPTRKWEVILSSGLQNFVYSRDHAAVLQLSYALSMNPTNSKLDNLLGKIEDGVAVKGERLTSDHPRGLLQELLFRIELAYNRNEHERVLSLLSDVLLMDPENVTAIERVGSTYYTMGRYQDALKAWDSAMRLENNPKERESLMVYMAEARKKLGLKAAPESKGLPGMSAPTAAEEATSNPLAAEPTAVEPVAPQIRPAAPVEPSVSPMGRRLAGDPREIPKLYQKGV